MSDRRWCVAGGEIVLGERTLIMGVVNVTPDSFSDGGEHIEAGAAIEHGRRLVAEGADVLDIGGESTRPGAVPVPEEEELRRVIPVVAGLLDTGVPISVDTSKPAVARAAASAGAAIINDVTALSDEAMAGVVAATGTGLVLMHMQGAPATMQDDPRYDDVVIEVRDFLLDRAAVAVAAGVAPDAIVIDPGIGFGKTLPHNLELLQQLDAFTATTYPVLVGTSRKAFIGTITGRPVTERDTGTAASIALAIASGVSIIRVHNVAAAEDARRVADAIVRHRAS